MKYHELGYSVIPVNGKVPAVKDWPWFSVNPQTAKEVEAMTSLTIKSTGLGVVLGRGLVALDIDTDDEWLLNELPESKVVKRGKTGLTAFYKTSVAVNTKRDKLYPVELLGIGAQSVMPPSVHPDTKEPYTFQCSELEAVDELTELKDPNATFEKLANLCKARKIFRTMKSGATGTGTGNGSGAGNGNGVAGVGGMLGSESPIMGRGGRNNYLTASAYAMCCNMQLNGESVEDVARKLVELDEKMYGKDAWFADNGEHKDGGKLSVFERAVKFVERARVRSTSNGDMKPEYKIEIIQNVVEPDIGLDAQNLMRDGFFEMPTVERYQHLLGQVPFLDAWSTYLVNESENYSPALTLGSGLAVLSACASNAYSFHKAAPNLFIMNIAPTGFGKDAPQRAVKRLLSKVSAEGNKYIGYDMYDSSKGVLLGLNRNVKRVRVDVQDEVSGLFEQLDFNLNSPHKITVEHLCRLWSAGRSEIGENAVTDKTKRITPIKNPHLVWLGSTTPRGLQALVGNQAAWEKGLVSRAMFFIETRTNDPRTDFFKDDAQINLDDTESDFSPEIIDAVTSSLCRPPVLENQSFSLTQDNWMTAIVPTALKIDHDARQFLNQHAKDVLRVRAELDATVSDGDQHPQSVLLTRRIENICRLLACWYVGCGAIGRITMEGAKWAVEVMTLSQGSVVRYMKDREASLQERLVERLRLRAKGKSNREERSNLKKRISAHLKALTGKEPPMRVVAEHLKELLDDGHIVHGVGGKTHYVWK
jgi:hypothetical protein